MALVSSSSSSNGQFDPTAYATFRKEQIARAKELREARTHTMGDNNPRITYGPKIAAQLAPGLTRSLSSSDIANRRCRDAPDQPPQKPVPHYALPLNHKAADRRNTIGGTTPVRAASSGCGTTALRSGTGCATISFASAPRHVVGRKSCVRQGMSDVRPISSFNDHSAFTDEELAAFSAAGAAAESLAAMEVGLPRGSDGAAGDANGCVAGASVNVESRVGKETPSTNQAGSSTADGPSTAAALAKTAKQHQYQQQPQQQQQLEPKVAGSVKTTVGESVYGTISQQQQQRPNQPPQHQQQDYVESHVPGARVVENVPDHVHQHREELQQQQSDVGVVPSVGSGKGLLGSLRALLRRRKDKENVQL